MHVELHVVADFLTVLALDAKQIGDVLLSGLLPLIVVGIAVGASVAACVIASDIKSTLDVGSTMAVTPTPYFRLRPGAALPVSGGSAELLTMLDVGSPLQQRYGYTPLLMGANGSLDNDAFRIGASLVSVAVSSRLLAPDVGP